MDAALAFLALVIELMVGYPDRLLRAIGHPVIWIGQLIGWLDRVLNRANLSYAGLTREFAPAPNLPRKRGRERSTKASLRSLRRLGCVRRGRWLRIAGSSPATTR